MSKPVITVEKVSKSYLLRHQQTEGSYVALRDVITDKAKSLFKPKKNITHTKELFWALKDISFEVNQGDRIGIIGRNGAGKSTLLKILSRIVAPTGGKITLEGRVASLLEVGTGFHPELTGRENIFLNGAILGMNKAEIKSKFDEIVDFSGVEKFLDTPVKRYSSGMYVRLAFSVAAHLEPEILIVDEVLAVGDAEFQKKCLGKMEEVSKGHGRTFLFVSHNMAAIQSLCTKSLFLKNGTIHYGPDKPEFIINKYLTSLNNVFSNTSIKERTDREGKGELRITNIKFLNETEEEISNLISGQEISIIVEYENLNNHFDGASLEIAISISRKGAHLITVLSNKYVNRQIKNISDKHSVKFKIDRFPLMTGAYSLNAVIRKTEIIQDWLKDAIDFEVENGDYYKTGLNMPESHPGVYINYSVF
jgi:lipopolysaccharide transport system ATP-binding protein